MRRIIVLCTVMLSVFFSLGCTAEMEPALVKVEDTNLEEKSDAKEIYIYVCGAVKNPGVYQLTTGSRIKDAIEVAGGFSDNADMNAVNMAAFVEDEMQLQVPDKTASQTPASDKVNLNTADKEKLMTLPGVGESKADSIIKYRAENGRFKKIEDIMEITGIKEGLFEKIKDSITV